MFESFISLSLGACAWTIQMEVTECNKVSIFTSFLCYIINIRAVGLFSLWRIDTLQGANVSCVNVFGWATVWMCNNCSNSSCWVLLLLAANSRRVTRIFTGSYRIQLHTNCYICSYVCSTITSICPSFTIMDYKVKPCWWWFIKQSIMSTCWI